MKLSQKIELITAGLASLFLPVLLSQQPATPGRGAGGRGGRGPQVEQMAWGPKKPAGWVAPNKPHWKLAEVVAKHKGQANWTNTVVSDDYLHADYVQMAPGEKTPRRMHPDTREWWIVEDGQIQFNIDGQESFIAKKGYLVQVPYRTFYSMEAIGDKPSLRLEVNIANARLMYPLDMSPPKISGTEFVKVRIGGKGAYDQGNKPYLDFNAMVEGTEKQRRFIADDRAVANVIMGYAKDLPAVNEADKGHFHEECAEFWMILAGKMEYKLEGGGMVVADEGDIVYAPRQTWHRPRFTGDQLACRLAMNGYQNIGHAFEPLDGAGGR